VSASPRIVHFLQLWKVGGMVLYQSGASNQTGKTLLKYRDFAPGIFIDAAIFAAYLI
jgi:hypothetical protein